MRPAPPRLCCLGWAGVNALLALATGGYLLVLTLAAIALANTMFGFVDAGGDLSGPDDERVAWLRQRWLRQDT